MDGCAAALCYATASTIALKCTMRSTRISIMAATPAESLTINVCAHVPQTERHLKAPRSALARRRTGAELIAARGYLQYDPASLQTGGGRMAPQGSSRLLLAPLVLVLVQVLVLVLVPGSLAYSCPRICRCRADTFQCTRETQLGSRARPLSVNKLKLSHLSVEIVPSHAFRDINVTRIEISQSFSITKIQRHAFLSLHRLSEISLQNIVSLRAIEKGAFTDLPRLEYLSICNTGMIHFPDFTSVSSLMSNFMLEMADNTKIDSIPANSFKGIAEEYIFMKLFRNGFKEIQSHAFNGTKINSLILRNNEHLYKIHEGAFDGALGPMTLDVSSTALSSFPAKGLTQVRFLTAVSAYTLKVLPPLESFTELLEANLTYPSHCCAFHTWQRKQRENTMKNLTRLCDVSELDMEPTADGLDVIDYIAFHYHYLELDCLNSPFIQCTPKPDAFNPCEDLLGYTVLRFLTWVITVCAVTGNLAVLVVLLVSHQKLTISRFLICNLAFADLCMGLYLLLIAAMDSYSSHQYYNHATDWQTGAGCGIAGFLTVFASELSVYTLTVISLERWHTITNAMHLHKRLRLRHVSVIMAAGWVFSLLVALLPLVGVSNYRKVSICLPMDIETLGSQFYVMALLILNVVAFVVVCLCYVCLYLSIHNPELATHHSDTKIAKRMAVLIFTDFLCMAPISFFAISAALRMPLITVSHSKILLILFYPINSLCNPFLYTIFTRGFRKDVWLVLRRWGYCQTKPHPFRSHDQPVHSISANNKLSGTKPPSFNFYAYQIKMQGCLLNKGAT
ncbi:Lutropin-choriogonadotropic hormone receptor [Merluccius polli]|nr:Lutropin-choriogonadotropic hormone receptor [Merluccius polli]